MSLGDPAINGRILSAAGRDKPLSALPYRHNNTPWVGMRPYGLLVGDLNGVAGRRWRCDRDRRPLRGQARRGGCLAQNLCENIRCMVTVGGLTATVMRAVSSGGRAAGF